MFKIFIFVLIQNMNLLICIGEISQKCNSNKFNDVSHSLFVSNAILFIKCSLSEDNSIFPAIIAIEHRNCFFNRNGKKFFNLKYELKICSKKFFLTGASSSINNTLFKGVLKHKGVTYIYMYGF